MKYETNWCDFWGQAKLILSHNKIKYGTWWCEFLGQEKLILDHHKKNYGTKPGHFLGYLKVISVYIGRWSYGRFWDDNIVFQKMKNHLTTGAWQDDIWCPKNIILLCTSDECNFEMMQAWLGWWVIIVRLLLTIADIDYFWKTETCAAIVPLFFNARSSLNPINLWLSVNLKNNGGLSMFKNLIFGSSSSSSRELPRLGPVSLFGTLLKADSNSSKE